MLVRFHESVASGVVNGKSVNKLRLDTHVYGEYDDDDNGSHPDWSKRLTLCGNILSLCD